MSTTTSSSSSSGEQKEDIVMSSPALSVKEIYPKLNEGDFSFLSQNEVFINSFSESDEGNPDEGGIKVNYFSGRYITDTNYTTKNHPKLFNDTPSSSSSAPHPFWLFCKVGMGDKTIIFKQ